MSPINNIFNENEIGDFERICFNILKKGTSGIVYLDNKFLSVKNAALMMLHKSGLMAPEAHHSYFSGWYTTNKGYVVYNEAKKFFLKK